MDELNADLRRTKGDRSRLEKEIASEKGNCRVFQDHIDQYFNREKEFLQTGDVSIVHSLNWAEDTAIMEHAGQVLEKKKEELDQQLALLESQEKDLEQEIGRARTLIQEKEINLVNTRNEHKNTEKDHQELLKALDRRKSLLALIGLSEENLWDQAKIDLGYQEVLARHASLEASAAESISQLSRELKSLNSGTSLEISDEVQSVFDQLNLKVQTGARWLRNSRMKDEKKKEMVQKHPFFPFSLILDQKDSEQLREELKKQKLYVSSPLIFCSREMLSNNDQFDFPNLSFYLQFNDNLIFPEQLEKMIRNTENERRRQEQFLKLQRTQRQNLENEKKRCDEDGLHFSNLQESQKKLDTLQKSIEKIIEEKNTASQKLDLNREQLDRLKEQIRTLNQSVLSQKARCREWKKLFDGFTRAVHDYHLMQKSEEQLSRSENTLRETESELSVLEEQIPVMSAAVAQAKEEVKKTQKNVDGFESFAESKPAEGTLEEILPRFDSLSQKLSASQYNVYYAEFEKARNRAKESKKKLDKLIRRYEFRNEEWKNLRFSQDAQFEQETRRDDLQDSLDEYNNRLIGLAGSISRLQGLIESNEKQMMEKTGTAKPLEKKDCRQMDLEKAKKTLEAQLTDVQNGRAELQKKSQQFRQIAERIRPVLLFSNVESDQDISLWTVEDLNNHTSDLIVSHTHQKNTEERQKKELDQKISRSLEEYRSKQAGCFDVLKSIQSLLDTPLNLPQEIEQKQALLQNRIDKTQADLRFLEENRKQLHQMLLDYVRNLHTQLKIMDQDTTITIDGNSRKMFSIEIKDWEEIEPIAKIRLEAFLDQLVEEVEANREKETVLISQRIHPAVLYDQLVEIRKIAIKLYKIEEDRQTRISWSQAGRMSGAEGFLCAFVVVSAVLNYQRKDAYSRIYGRKAAHAMILDNPFAYVQSGHIIRALMSLCETTGTQLVAFSNVGNSDVINAFKNIYSLRMIPRYDDKNHLIAEHEKTTQDQREIDSIQIHVQETLLAPDEETSEN